MEHATFLDKIADIAAKIGGLIASVVAIWGALRLLPRVVNHVKLISELQIALETARTNGEAAKQYRLTADSYRDRIDGLLGQVREAIARADSAADRTDIALVYIVDLLNFIKSGRPIVEAPPLPEELEQDVYEIIRRRAMAPEAPKVDRPFLASPSSTE